ncbi:hypothetical protein [Deinococcus aquaedulcis]|uniref:hypothetical protein n=1 Tax=Deinococcus aquaedulcis TaxID=2840455 RepID=UPI001C83EC2F|nr:hypothetical protein [Deinococcus aquaedulcis]
MTALPHGPLRHVLRQLDGLCRVAALLLGALSAVWWVAAGGPLETRLEVLAWAVPEVLTLWFIWRAVQAGLRGALSVTARELGRAGVIWLAASGLSSGLEVLRGAPLEADAFWGVAALGFWLAVPLLLPGVFLVALSLTLRQIAALRRDEELTI